MGSRGKLIRTVLDWETAYGKHPETGENITLSGTNGLTTEHYVRHEAFKAHGLGVKIDQDPAFYLYKRDDLIHFLKTHPWDRTFAIAHHANFDGAILGWRCGIHPAFWGDTLSMARAIYPHEPNSLERTAELLGVAPKGTELSTVKGLWELTDEQQEVLGAYCINDCEITAQVFDRLKGHFPVSEMRLIDWTIRAFTEPAIVVDQAPLLESFIKEKRTKRALMKRCGADKKALGSASTFPKLLLELGVDPPKKLSPSKVKDGRVDPDAVTEEPPVGELPVFRVWKGITPEEKIDLKARKDAYPWAYAFGKSDELFKRLLNHPDQRVKDLVEARLGVKSTIKETRTKRFYKIGGRGLFPVYLKYYGAHTNRWCLTGDTEIFVLRGDEVMCMRMTGLRGNDLIWDGASFVTHGGLVCRGEQKVITYDQITGTPEHRVFCGAAEELITLAEARDKEASITEAVLPMGVHEATYALERPIVRASTAPVYDILDCGPNNRFVANGKLVHNSGGDKQNAQNLNRVDPSDPTAGALRMSLTAPEGHLICVRDLSQIESRCLVYWAGQEDMLDMFRAGGDPYDFMASKIYGRTVRRKTTPEDAKAGQVGKLVVLGAGYQMGWASMQEQARVGFMGMPGLLFDETYVNQLDVSIEGFEAQRSYTPGCATLRDQAIRCQPLDVSETDHITHCAVTKHLIDTFRGSNPKVVALWKACQASLGSMLLGDSVQLGSRPLVSTSSEGLVLPNGMKVRYSELRKSSDGREFKYLADARKHEWTKIYAGKITENGVQALARLILSDQLLRVDNQLRGFDLRDGEVCRVMTSTHDELVAVVPERQAEKAFNMLGHEMSIPPDWCSDLPLKSAGGYAKRYGDCEH